MQGQLDAQLRPRCCCCLGGASSNARSLQFADWQLTIAALLPPQHLVVRPNQHDCSNTQPQLTIITILLRQQLADQAGIKLGVLAGQLDGHRLCGRNREAGWVQSGCSQHVGDRGRQRGAVGRCTGAPCGLGSQMSARSISD